MSDRKISTPTTTDNSLSVSIKWYRNSNFCLAFKGSCLKHKTETYTPPNRTSFFNFYELYTCSRDLSSDFTLKDYLFGSVKLAKSVYPDRYLYSGCGIGFDSSSLFSLPNFDWAKMLLFLELT